MSQHTPGPWDMQPSSDGAHSKRIFANGSYLATVGGSDQSWPELVANARLIAAAPEMLQMLDKCLSHLDGCSHGYSDELWDGIEAVIAKARGNA